MDFQIKGVPKSIGCVTHDLLLDSNGFLNFAWTTGTGNFYAHVKNPYVAMADVIALHASGQNRLLGLREFGELSGQLETETAALHHLQEELARAAAESARGAFDFYGHADHRAWIWLRPCPRSRSWPRRLVWPASTRRATSTIS